MVNGNWKLSCEARVGRVKTSTGILTCYPSTTPFGLALGADLPVVDEPSDGNLGHSADMILTCLVRYSCRHSHFHALHLNFSVKLHRPWNAPLPHRKAMQPSTINS
jgi:hypothetical protein